MMRKTIKLFGSTLLLAGLITFNVSCEDSSKQVKSGQDTASAKSKRKIS